MTEQELRTIISESVVKVLKNYGLISEMAHDSKEYKRRVDGLLPQIAENWCLIYFFVRIGKPCLNISHWMNELNGHMASIMRMKPKNGRIDKLLYQVWNENDFDTDPQCVYICISNKFFKEGVDIINDKRNAEVLDEACQSFVKSTREIINIIANKNTLRLREYIYNIGKQQVFE